MRNAALKRGVVLAWFSASLAGAGLPQALAQDDLSELRELWNAGNYEEVIIKGSALREQPFGRTLELDYMLGTSLCRAPELQVDGIKFLAWCLSNYKMDQRDQAKIVQETEQCAQALATAPAPITAMTVKSSVGAGVGVSGKMFHYLSGDQAFGATAIKIVAPKTLAELRARLTPIAQPDSAARKIAALAGKTFEVKVFGRFVIANANAKTDYAEMSRRLEIYESFFAAAFGLKLPPYMVTVYVVPDIRQYRELALKLHGFQVPEASIGYSFRDDLSLAVFCRDRFTGTLYHELFHLMARTTFGDIPPWLDEGMAALYEVSKIDSARVLGLNNWRGQVLEQLWERRPSLAQLVQMNWEEFDRPDTEYPSEDNLVKQAAHHATARCFLQYLQEQGKLAEVFNTFRQRKPADLKTTPEADAMATLETILQKPAQTVDQDFAAWFKAKRRY